MERRPASRAIAERQAPRGVSEAVRVPNGQGRSAARDRLQGKNSTHLVSGAPWLRALSRRCACWRWALGAGAGLDHHPGRGKGLGLGRGSS